VIKFRFSGFIVILDGKCRAQTERINH